MCGGEGVAETVRRDVVNRDSAAVHLDDREQLAVALLELRVAGDVDLLDGEAQLGRERGERPARPLAEVAAGRAVDDDARRLYG